MLHLAEAGNYGLLEWWYGSVIDLGVPFDIIGLSYYPFWHGTLENLQNSLNGIAALYDKDIILVEFAYPFTLGNDDQLGNIVSDPALLTSGYPATPAGQRVMTRKVMNIVSEIPDGHGLGVFYWDAAWTAVPGNGWENQDLFDFDGVVLPAILEFEGKRSHSDDGSGD